MGISTVWTNGNRGRRWGAVGAALAASAYLVIGGAQSAGARELPVQNGGDGERPEIARDRWDRRGDWRDVREFERTFDRLLAAFGWPGATLAFHLPQRGMMLDETNFRQLAASEGGAV